VNPPQPISDDDSCEITPIKKSRKQQYGDFPSEEIPLKKKRSIRNPIPKELVASEKTTTYE